VAPGSLQQSPPQSAGNFPPSSVSYFLLLRHSHSLTHSLSDWRARGTNARWWRPTWTRLQQTTRGQVSWSRPPAGPPPWGARTPLTEGVHQQLPGDDGGESEEGSGCGGLPLILLLAKGLQQQLQFYQQLQRNQQGQLNQQDQQQE
jgi:hypothetical protein